MYSEAALTRRRRQQIVTGTHAAKANSGNSV